MVVSFIGGGSWSTQRKPQTVASYSQTLSHKVVSGTPHQALIAPVVVNSTTIRSRPQWPLHVQMYIMTSIHC